MFEEFIGNCLPFEESSAIQYAGIVAHRQKSGRPINVGDGARIQTRAVQVFFWREPGSGGIFNGEFLTVQKFSICLKKPRQLH